MQAIEDHLGDVLALEPRGAGARLVEIAIHPDEGVAGARAGRREAVAGKTAVEAPGDEERCALRLPVRQMAGVEGHTHSDRTKAWPALGPGGGKRLRGRLPLRRQVMKRGAPSGCQ